MNSLFCFLNYFGLIYRLLEIMDVIHMEVYCMRKMKKMTFEELVLENKKELMKDQEALDKLEERVEQRLLDKLS